MYYILRQALFLLTLRLISLRYILQPDIISNAYVSLIFSQKSLKVRSMPSHKAFNSRSQTNEDKKLCVEQREHPLLLRQCNMAGTEAFSQVYSTAQFVDRQPTDDRGPQGAPAGSSRRGFSPSPGSDPESVTQGVQQTPGKGERAWMKMQTRASGQGWGSS